MDNSSNDNLKYIIVDGCVAAANYVEESSHRYPEVIELIQNIFKYRKNSNDCEFRLIIPNVCIPEVFSIFSKYRYGSWNRHVKGHTIDDLKYWKARLSFKNDIHNGKVLMQRDLSRYDIVATDLIAAPDHFFKHTPSYSSQPSAPMGAFDHCIIGMGIQLVKAVGKENVLILTLDNRMDQILERVKRVTMDEGAKMGLIRIARDLGLEYGPEIYPKVLNMAQSEISILQSFFRQWPLELPKGKEVKKSMRLTAKQEEQLIEVYITFTEKYSTTESIPYTDEFEVFCDAFVSKTGLDMSRSQIFKKLSNMRKAKKLPKKIRG